MCTGKFIAPSGVGVNGLTIFISANQEKRSARKKPAVSQKEVAIDFKKKNSSRRCAVRPRGQTLGGDPCLSTGDTREALPARAQAHQLGRTHLKTAVNRIFPHDVVVSPAQKAQVIDLCNNAIINCQLSSIVNG
jgi:hypothetical protein